MYLRCFSFWRHSLNFFVPINCCELTLFDCYLLHRLCLHTGALLNTFSTGISLFVFYWKCIAYFSFVRLDWIANNHIEWTQYSFLSSQSNIHLCQCIIFYHDKLAVISCRPVCKCLWRSFMVHPIITCPLCRPIKLSYKTGSIKSNNKSL